MMTLIGLAFLLGFCRVAYTNYQAKYAVLDADVDADVEANPYDCFFDNDYNPLDDGSFDAIIEE